MFAPCTWKIDQTMILNRAELSAVLADLSRRSLRSLNARLSLVIVRLACCCGLRASEIGHLRLGDVRVDVDSRPHLRIRPGVGKGRKARTVPLWWDAGTLDDITAWTAQRQEQDADDLFICSMLANRRGRPLSRHALRLRFQRACRRALGHERARRVTIHHGRHTFVSHALAGGRTLAEVRDAAGHSHVGITSLYLHVAVEDDAAIGNLFQFAPSRP
jgi:integrase